MSGTGAKIMCHIGGVESPQLMSQILDLLRPRDILTHCYSGAPGDVTLLDVVEGPVEFVDTRNNKRSGKVTIKPAQTIAAGIPFGRPFSAPFSVR